MLPDAVVIGGGIVGCSCAYYLAREGVKVCLLEKGTIASGTSRAGQSHIVLWEEPDINLRLEKASRLLYEALAEELPFDIEYRRTGSLALVENAADWEPFARTVHSLQARGLDCQLLSGTDLTRMEPNLAQDLAGGAYFPEDAQVNPILTTLALAQGAKCMGAEIRPFTEVTGIELSEERKVVAVNTTAGRIPTAIVVNAAGVWSAAIGKMVGLEIPVIPRRGHIIVTEPVPDNLIHCKIILAAGYMQTLGATSGVAMSANIQQTRSGNLLLGSSRDFGGFDRTVKPEVIRAQLARNLRFLPALANIHVIRTYAGLRPYSPDLVPIISTGDGVQGFYIATGHEGAGITMAPITGKLISEMITGKAPTVPLEPLSLRRFSHRQEEG
ncbi:MAG: NAD(P)/FAD-dependent oxidoreductase [Anaerolineae bacterium]